MCFDDISGCLGAKSDFLVLFCDQDVPLVRYDQKFLLYKDRQNRNFEYREEISKFTNRRKNDGNSETVNSRRRIWSLFDSTKNQLALIFQTGKIQITSLTHVKNSNSENLPLPDHMSFEENLEEHSPNWVLKFKDLFILMKSIISDCQTIVNDLGVYPFLLYGKFIQNRLVRNHLDYVNDQNVKHLVLPVFSCLNACLKIADDTSNQVDIKVCLSFSLFRSSELYFYIMFGIILYNVS